MAGVIPQVYYVRSPSCGSIKIGQTARTERVPAATAQAVANRIRSLQTGSPFPLELVAHHEYPDGDRGIHSRLGDEHRLTGEWFSPHPDVVSVLGDLCSNWGAVRGPGWGAVFDDPVFYRKQRRGFFDWVSVDVVPGYGGTARQLDVNPQLVVAFRPELRDGWVCAQVSGAIREGVLIPPQEERDREIAFAESRYAQRVSNRSELSRGQFRYLLGGG